MDIAIAIEKIRPGSQYLLNKSVPPDQVIIEWRGPGDEPTQQELEGAWQVYSERVVVEQKAATKLKSNIKATVQSAEGVLLKDLTQGQFKALMAALLWKAGGVADDMTVKNLGDWYDREEARNQAYDTRRNEGRH